MHLSHTSCSFYWSQIRTERIYGNHPQIKYKLNIYSMSRRPSRGPTSSSSLSTSSLSAFSVLSSSCSLLNLLRRVLSWVELLPARPPRLELAINIRSGTLLAWVGVLKTPTLSQTDPKRACMASLAFLVTKKWVRWSDSPALWFSRKYSLVVETLGQSKHCGHHIIGAHLKTSWTGNASWHTFAAAPIENSFDKRKGHFSDLHKEHWQQPASRQP